MAFTDAEESRIQAIEKILNDVQLATKNLASKAQFNQLLMIKQKEIEALIVRIETLESEIALLQNEIE